jgi:hypothetical protein
VTALSLKKSSSILAKSENWRGDCAKIQQNGAFFIDSGKQEVICAAYLKGKIECQIDRI